MQSTVEQWYCLILSGPIYSTVYCEHGNADKSRTCLSSFYTSQGSNDTEIAKMAGRRCGKDKTAEGLFPLCQMGLRGRDRPAVGAKPKTQDRKGQTNRDDPMGFCWRVELRQCPRPERRRAKRGGDGERWGGRRRRVLHGETCRSCDKSRAQPAAAEPVTAVTGVVR